MNAAAAFALFIIAAASVATVVYSNDPANSTGTTTRFITVPENSASVTSPNGLQLRVSLNATSLVPDQAVAISVLDYNTLLRINVLNAVSHWPFPYALSIGPCGTVNLPMGMVILSGYYTRSNMSSGEPLQLDKPGPYMCPMILTGIGSYSFHPQSSSAEIYGSCGSGSCLKVDVNATRALKGYWSVSLPGTSVFHSFSPGVYTVVAGDEWGGILVAHFIVLPEDRATSMSISSSTSSTSTITTTLSPNPGGSTSITTDNSSTSCPSQATCGSFTYVSGSQIKMNSVQATRFVCNNCGAINGQSYVTFEVNFENNGSTPIYVAAGTGGLSVSTLGNSSVLHAVATQPCPGTFTIAALSKGQNYTMYGPGCDAGFDYQLVHAGSVTMTFSFDWTTNYQVDTFPDSTTITAQFSFA